MKSVVPAIAASILTIFAFAPSSFAATAPTAAAGAPATRMVAALKPSTVLAQLSREMSAQQASPDAAENQNDSGDANDADNSANDDQSNGEDAQNGDPDNNSDPDQNANNGDNADQDSANSADTQADGGGAE